MPQEQARLFLAMIACGWVMGGLRSVLALVLRGNSICAMMDMALGAGCAAGMTVVALFLGENPFRLYAFAGVLTGLALNWALEGTIVRLFRVFFIKMSKKVEK